MKILSTVFGILAILLSDMMCVVVTYNYCYMRWGYEYCYAVPANMAFLLVIPYAIGIAVCVVLAIVFKRKVNQQS
ncbi:MAG: hypothetical protein ACI4C1_07950 [Lachnospiraceae bacterium]